MKRSHKSYLAALLALVLIVIMCAVASGNARAVKVPTFTLLAREETRGGSITAYKLEAEGRVFVSVVYVEDGENGGVAMDTLEVGK